MAIMRRAPKKDWRFLKSAMLSLVLFCSLSLGLSVVTNHALAYDKEFCFRVTWIAVLCNEPPMTKGEWKKFTEQRPQVASRWRHPPSRSQCTAQAVKLNEYLTLCHLLYDFNPTDEPTYLDSYHK